MAVRVSPPAGAASGRERVVHFWCQVWHQERENAHRPRRQAGDVLCAHGWPRDDTTEGAGPDRPARHRNDRRLPGRPKPTARARDPRSARGTGQVPPDPGRARARRNGGVGVEDVLHRSGTERWPPRRRALASRCRISSVDSPAQGPSSAKTHPEPSPSRRRSGGVNAEADGNAPGRKHGIGGFDDLEREVLELAKLLEGLSSRGASVASGPEGSAVSAPTPQPLRIAFLRAITVEGIRGIGPLLQLAEQSRLRDTARCRHEVVAMAPDRGEPSQCPRSKSQGRSSRKWSAA
jgi:hypothetical protein